MENNRIKVRFAPSPTGDLHVGGLRSALYNYIFAKQNNGVFLLRIEDTDRVRYVEGSVEKIIETLKWIGIEWEGEPHIQSEHLEIYKKYAQQLVEEGKAYYCFCEPERLQKMREGQTANKQAPMYDQYCLKNITEEEINRNLKNNCSFTIRLKVPKDEFIEFEDIVRGKVRIDTSTIDDQILLKSDGFPTYHLANVVDDHEMGITHVIRGEEWLPSTSKHILLYKAFGWAIPQFAHLPLLLSADKKKLSKRMGDVAVEDYIKNGYLKEAIINFVAMLGWNPGEGSMQEIFSLDELIQKFDFTHVHKAGAVFDLKKLDWLNSQYIKKLSIADLYNLSLDFWKQKDFYNNASADKKTEEYLKKVLKIERDRLSKLSEVGESNKFFFQDIDYDKELLRWRDMSDKKLKYSLELSKNILENIDWKNLDLENTYNTINTALNNNLAVSESSDVIDITNLEESTENLKELKIGELYWPLRVALTGERKSPAPAEVAWVLGKVESIKRLESAIKKI